VIDSVSGRVIHQSDEAIVILNSGIGIEIRIPVGMSRQTPDSETIIFTRLIVREDSLTLYGFATMDQRSVFDELIKVSGVGPRLAQAILGTLQVDRLKQAIAHDQADVLMTVPGIGKRVAQKILLDLKDRFFVSADGITPTAWDDEDHDVLAALTTLGYSVIEAQAAIQSIPPHGAMSTEERLRACLQYLGGI
jgi:holliday junction DNA helicase RuvA